MCFIKRKNQGRLVVFHNIETWDQEVHQAFELVLHIVDFIPLFVIDGSFGDDGIVLGGVEDIGSICRSIRSEDTRDQNNRAYFT